MLRLTNAVVPWDGDPILIPSSDSIVSVSVDHTMANGDCTLVELSTCTKYQVKESVDQIEGMIEIEKGQKQMQKNAPGCRI